MDELVLRAKIILADMFKIGIRHFDKHFSRKVKIIEARRFLIYFLRDELGITYNEIVKYCPAITNHATAIHHYKRLKELIVVERSTRSRYRLFRKRVVDDPTNLIENQIIEMIENRKQINNLKKLLL